jgi:hypothetical protein
VGGESQEGNAVDVTSRVLNRATLARQLLLDRLPIGVVEAVRRVGALQAQEPASPYLAMWSRVAGFDPADLDRAFADGEVVKASLLRLTVHAVHSDDYPAFQAAMLPSLRASRLNDRRYTDTGLAAADADMVIAPMLEFLARPRRGAEIGSFVANLLGKEQPRIWWALKMFAPLHHVPTGGPWSFGRDSSFVAAHATWGPESQAEAVGRLLVRYLEAFGPASARDFAQFTMLRAPVIGQALKSLAGRVEELEGPDGPLFDLPGAPLPPADTFAPPRLLPMWDSILLAYSDRRRVIPPDYRPFVIRRNGDVLPTLLVDGYVAGVWRQAGGQIEATAFHPLDKEVWDGLAREAHALMELLKARDPAVYRRYARWWTELPATEVRSLPG